MRAIPVRPYFDLPFGPVHAELFQFLLTFAATFASGTFDAGNRDDDRFAASFFKNLRDAACVLCLELLVRCSLAEFAHGFCVALGRAGFPRLASPLCCCVVPSGCRLRLAFGRTVKSFKVNVHSVEALAFVDAFCPGSFAFSFALAIGALEAAFSFESKESISLAFSVSLVNLT